MAIKKESLVSSNNRIEAPFIRVEINGYTFGVYEEKSMGVGPNGLWKNISSKYPNYVESLTVKKINGQVNTYELAIKYPVTQYSDPNFFEKLFGSVSGTRKIKFSYGDFMVPDYSFRDESAIITKITVTPGVTSSVITYNITAVSDTILTTASNYSFPKTVDKPSNVIKYYLFNEQYHLQELFPGMKDPSLVESLIASDDKIVHIEPKHNVSTMEYLSYLVSNMIPTSSKDDSVIQGSLYALSIHEDNTDTYGGSYFKVQKIENNWYSLDGICTYEIDIGYPSANFVTNFTINSNDDWALYYNYNKQASSTDYVKRLNSKGELELVYTPELTRGSYTLENEDKTWWTQVTEFPIEASITIRGLLKPAILMNYVKINMWYWGNKYMLSGYYLISGQEDHIDGNGYRTTLSLIRCAPDGDDPYANNKWGGAGWSSTERPGSLIEGISNSDAATNIPGYGGSSRGAGARKR